MSDLNQCNFIGRLGSDPETRYTGNGDSVTNISLACGWKSKDKEGTEWVRVTAFGKLAEIMQQYLHKGSQVYIQGRMKTDKWQDKEGNDRYSTSVIADRMQMLGSKGETQQRSDNPQNGAVEQPPAASGAAGDGFDSIPF